MKTQQIRKFERYVEAVTETIPLGTGDGPSALYGVARLALALLHPLSAVSCPDQELWGEIEHRELQELEELRQNIYDAARALTKAIDAYGRFWCRHG